ncbi:MAG: alpha/beta hydrolase [Deltaproteobacteria bacterium]|nr:alpha/beta hydrolase [Deltaproteobacteria bacterium]
MAMPTIEEWRAGGATWRWRGHEVFWRAAGAGPVVLLIHGFPTASWDWAAIWDALAARYRVLTLDMIGFGFSAKPRAFDYTIGAQADLYEALLARDGVTRYRIVAHDYGDTVAQELLARQAEGAAARIEGAVLLNGGLFPESHRPLATQRLLASPLGGLVARATTFPRFAAAMRRICARPLPDDELAAMWALVEHNDGRGVMPKLIGYMAERRRSRARWVGAITGARVPIRVIDGVDDPISGGHMLARYRELVRDPDIVELAGVGHYPQVEAPAEVTRATLEALARLDRATAA